MNWKSRYMPQMYFKGHSAIKDIKNQRINCKPTISRIYPRIRYQNSKLLPGVNKEPSGYQFVKNREFKNLILHSL